MSSTLLFLRAVCRTSLDSTILCSFCVYAKFNPQLFAGMHLLTIEISYVSLDLRDLEQTVG